MKLTDLNPRYFSIADKIVGLTFDCPHCRSERLGVAFHHAGYEAIEDSFIRANSPDTQHIWLITGDGFGNFSLSPSIDASASGHWHGFITNGEVT